MATQQAEKPQKQRRNFLRWIAIVAFVLAVILLVIAGYSWLTKVWGDQTNTLSAIFSISGTFFSLIGLLTFLSSKDAKTSPSSLPSQPFIINNYVNPTQINTQQPIPLPTSDRHLHPANIETDKQRLTAPDHQLHQGGSASPLLNASPTAAPAPAMTAPSDSFFESAKSTNKEPTMKLSYKERSNLTDALLEVYPNQEEFEIMFERRFERKLNTLVDGGNYWTRVYHLIERTEAENWTYYLILYAHEERRLNPALEGWLQKYATKKVTPEAQQVIPIPPRIAELPQNVQTITAEQERQQQPPSHDEQPLAKARKSFKEAYDAVNASKVIFAGRGDIQQIHYSQATTALGQVLACVQNLQGLSQTFSPADRERLIMDLRRISTEVTESMKQIAGYGTLDANQRESERKDTASRLSSVVTRLDNLVGI